MGRPTKFNAAMGEEIQQLIAAGVAESTAAKLAGIAPSTLELWKERGSKGCEPYKSFLEGITRARAKAEAIAIGQIRRAGADDWRAASWWLTHHPATRERWSDAGAVRTAEANLLAKVVGVLQAEVPDPQQRHRLLTALVAAGCGPMPEGGADAASS